MKRRRVLEEVFPQEKKTYRIYTTLEVRIIQNSQEFVATEMI
jgi:hypothetical protein